MDRLDLGPDYPCFLRAVSGEPLPLLRERRWSREFGTPRAVTIISRFRDGSATMSHRQLCVEWPTWSSSDRRDFAMNCGWLREQADFPDIVRFVVAHGSYSEWSMVAQSVATCLPHEEAFAILDGLISQTPAGRRANLLQGVMILRHARSLELLMREIRALLEAPSVWDDDPFLNWLTYDLTCALDDALTLGADPMEFEDVVRRLATHPCAGNVDAARQRFASLYDGVFAAP